MPASLAIPNSQTRARWGSRPGDPLTPQQFGDENNRLINARKQFPRWKDGVPQFAPPPQLGEGGLPPIGGTPAFGGMGQQAPIDAHTYGDTFAQVNTGSASGGGLDAFYDDNPKAYGEFLAKADASKPQPLPMLAENRDWKLAEAAYGTSGKGPLPGPLPIFSDFIAGDPQKNGKPNPEVISVRPDGIHVTPIQDMDKVNLPKFGEGTGSRVPFHRTDGRVVPTKGAKKPCGGLEEFYKNNPDTPTAAQMENYKMLANPQLKMPIRMPALPKLAYGTVKDMGDRREAFDDKGNLVGWSTGVSAPQLPPSLPPLAPSAAQLVRGIESEERYNARRAEMNPDNIHVGFSRRTPLDGFARADALRAGGQSREEAGIARLQRQVMREAKRDPRLGAAVLDSKARGEQAAYDRQQRERTAALNRQATTERTVLTQTGANDRSAATLKSQAERDEAKRKQTLQDSGNQMAVDMAGQQQRFASMMLTGRIPKTDAVSIGQIGHPAALKSRLDYYEFNQPQPPKPIMETFPGTGVYVNPSVSNSGEATMTRPAMPSFAPSMTLPFAGKVASPMQFPGQPAQFKPLKKPEPVKPPPVKNFGNMEVPNWREFDESTGKWVPVQFADKNQNGVPDNMEGGGAIPSQSTSAISALIARAKAK